MLSGLLIFINTTSGAIFLELISILYLRNAVKQEQLLIKDSAGFSSELQELFSNVREGNEKCGKLYEQMETLSNRNQRDSERSLQIRETQVSGKLQ